MNDVGRTHDPGATTTAPGTVAATLQSSESVTPLFFQEMRAEIDRLDAGRIICMFAMSTGSDVVIPFTDFISEVIWYNGIKDV